MNAAWLLLALGLAGCRPPAAIPALSARAWRAWSLPPDGAAQPAPRSLAIGPRDEIAVLDTAGRVLIYHADGALLRQWPALDIRAGQPEGLVMLRDGRVVVCDTHRHQIVCFDGEGKVLKTFGHWGDNPGEFRYPVGIAKDAGENLYICEYGGNDRVQKFTREGEYLLQFGYFGPQPGQFQRPCGLAWSGGRIYVTDVVSNRVLVFTDTGQRAGLLGAPGQPPLTFDLPFDLAAASDGTLSIIEYGSGRLARVSLEGRLLGRYGHSGSGEGEFASPWGLAIDSQGRVHIADARNRRIVTLRF